MRRGVNFPAQVDSAHWVPDHGMRAHYAAGRLHRLGNEYATARPQTSCRPWGNARNLPAIQQFGGPLHLNAPHAVASSRIAGGSSKWRAF